MKEMKKAAGLIALSGTLWLSACSNNATTTQSAAAATPSSPAEGVKIEDIQIPKTLDEKSVTAGKQIYELKCQACHKLDDTKLVGPGWKGITQRRKPGWIVAMATNPDQMLNADPEAQKLLEQILVRMPNQNLSHEDALNVLAFMLRNDGAK